MKNPSRKITKRNTHVFLHRVVAPFLALVYILTGLLLPVLNQDIYTRAQDVPVAEEETPAVVEEEVIVEEETPAVVEEEVIVEEETPAVVEEEVIAEEETPAVALDGEGDELDEILEEEQLPEEELFDCVEIPEDELPIMGPLLEEEVLVEEEVIPVVEEEVIPEDELPIMGPLLEEEVIPVVEEEVTPVVEEEVIPVVEEEVTPVVEEVVDYEEVEREIDGKWFRCKRRIVTEEVTEAEVVVEEEGPIEGPALDPEIIREIEDKKTLISGMLIRTQGDLTEENDVARIKLADVQIPGKNIGDSITANKAIEVLIGLTTTEQDIEKAVIRSVFKQNSSAIASAVLEDRNIENLLRESAKKGLLQTLQGKVGKTLAQKTVKENLAIDLEDEQEIEDLFKLMITDELKKEILKRVVQNNLQNIEVDLEDDVTELIKNDYNKFVLQELLGKKLQNKPSALAILQAAVALDEEVAVTKPIIPIIEVAARGLGGNISIPMGNLHFEAGSLIMSIDPIRKFRPGLYQITVKINNPITSQTDTIVQDFAWGVLTMNTDRDIFQIGDIATVNIGVLDDRGRPACDAEVVLEIESPSGSISYPEIINTDSCEIYDSLNTKPDYLTNYTFSQQGVYILRLSATLSNGNMRTMYSKVNVTRSPDFVITRRAATRLYPVGLSPMSIEVYFYKDFDGYISDVVPSEFIISAIESAGTAISNNGERRISDDGKTKLITWKVKAVAGNTQSFRYFYDAPDSSPELYTVGPLNSSGELLEKRQWQIANDKQPLAVSETNELLGQWLFNTGVGNTIFNDSPYKNDGAILNAESADWSDNIPSKENSNLYSMNFDGINQYMVVENPTTGELDFGDTANFTITGWVRCDTDSGTQALITKRYDIVAEAPGYAIMRDDTGLLEFTISDGTDTYNRLSGSGYSCDSDSGWTHFTLVWDQSVGAEFYINGDLYNGTATGTASDIGSLINSNPLVFGATADTRNLFKGGLDDIRIYNRALNANEIGAQWSSYKPGVVASDLMLWLKADEGLTILSNHVAAWADQSGKRNDFTQDDSNFQPELIADGLNFHNTVSYDGIDDYLMNFSLTSEPVSIFGVTRSTDAESDGTAIIQTNLADGNLTAPFTSDDATYYKGEIAEILFYSSDTSTGDLSQRILSYLGVKYGITLDQTAEQGGTDYLDSASTVIWSQDSSDTFEYDIAGIGQDEVATLFQPQSKSQNNDAILRVAEATSLDNLDFFMWSNNNGEAVWTDEGAPEDYKLLSRQWQAQESNDVGQVDFEFDVNNAEFDVPDIEQGIDDYYFVYDSNNDGNLADETPIVMTDDGTNGDDEANDNKWTVQMNLDSGNIFTISTLVDTTPPVISITDITEDSPYIYIKDSTLYYSNDAEEPSTFTINVEVEDPESGIVSVEGSQAFGDAPKNFLTPYALNYSIEQNSICPESKMTVTATAGSGQTSSLEIDCILDGDGPVDGVITYADDFQSETAITIEVNPGTDAVSGMSEDTANYLLEYKSAPLADNACGEFGEWTDAGVDESASATSYEFTGAGENCYQFRYSVRDSIQNQSTFTSTNATKIDTVAPIPVSMSINAGDNETDSNQVTLTLLATDEMSGVAEMQLSCNNQKWTTPEAYSETRTFDLTKEPGAGCNSSKGEKEVYARFSDKVGNWGDQAVSDTITFADSKKPAKPAKRNLKNWEKGGLYEDFKPEKERKELRNATSKHFENPDGSITAVLTAGPVHYEDNGEWKEIVPDIMSNDSGEHSDYEYANTDNKFKSFYPKKGAKKGLIIEFGQKVYEDWINPEMRWLDGNGDTLQSIPANEIDGVVNESSITYPLMYKGTDVRFEQVLVGRKLDIILKDRSAIEDMPTGASELAYCEEVLIPQGWTYETQSDPQNPDDVSVVTFSDASGQQVAQYPVPYIYEEANRDNETNAWYSIESSGNSLTVCTIIKAGWLTAPERQFPIVVDPYVYATGTYYTGTVGYTSPSTYYKWNSDLDIGCWTGSCPPYRRGWVRFDLSSIFDGSTITNANFYTYLRRVPTIATYYVYAYVGVYDALYNTAQELYNDTSYYCGDSDTVLNTDSINSVVAHYFTATGYGYLEDRLVNNDVTIILAGTTTDYIRLWRYDTASYYPRMAVSYTPPTITVSNVYTDAYNSSYYWFTDNTNTPIYFSGPNIGSGTCYGHVDANTTYGSSIYSANLGYDCTGIVYPSSACSDGTIYYGCIYPCDGLGTCSNYSCDSSYRLRCDNTNPYGSFSISPTYYGPNTYSTTTSIAGTADDTYSGVGNVKVSIYRSDGYFWYEISWATGAVELTATGTTSWYYSGISSGDYTNGYTYTVYPKVYDKVGNYASLSSDSFIWDSAAPTTPGAPTTTWVGDHYVKTSFTASTTGSTDGSSGIRGYRLCRSDDNVTGCYAWVASESSSTSVVVSGSNLPSDGAWRYYYWYAYDNVGNQSASSSGTYIRMDSSAPYLSSQTTFSGWYNTNQTSYFYYSDAGCGVASGSPASCVISTEGSSSTCTTTGLSVCDHLSTCNTTNVTSNSLQLDKTNPVLTRTGVTESSSYIYYNGSTLFYKGNATTPGSFTINYTLTDSLSGPWYILGDPAFGESSQFDYSSPYAVTFSIEQNAVDGQTLVHGYDNAGINVQDQMTTTSDTTAPTVTSTTENDTDNYVTDGTSITITSDGADASSGMDTCYAYWDNNTAYAGTETSLGNLGTDCDGIISTPNSTDGTWYYCVRPIDKVSNENYSCTNAMTYDETVPATPTITSVAGDTTEAYFDTTNNSSTAIVFTTSDATSGVSNCRWSTSDYDYERMENSCGSTTTCTTNLSGDGGKSVYISCIDNAGNYSANRYVVYYVDSTAPYIDSITSVAGDTSSPYYDTTDNSSTYIAFVAFDNVMGPTCKWDYSSVAYASMANTCSVGDNTYSFTSTLSGNGAKTVYIACKDEAGWTVGPTAISYTIDSAAPTVALTYSENPANAGAITVTATYSEKVNTGETPTISINQPGTTDISGAVMTIGANESIWTYSYTVVAATGSTYVDGTATVSLSTTHDQAGNTAGAPTGNTFTIDTTAPTGGSFTINSAATYTTSQTGNTLNVTCPTDSWATVQMAYGNSVSPTNWTTCTATVSSYDLGSGQGTKTVYMRFRDGGSNTTSETTDSITLDSVAPTVTINQAGGQADPTKTSPINFTVVFNESVTGFATGDVTLTGTAGATTGTVTGSGTTYNVAVSGMTGDGTVIATIGASKAIDAAGNNNAASTSTDNTVTYDTTGPTISSFTATNTSTTQISLNPAATDSGSGLNATPYYYTMTAGTTCSDTYNSGWIATDPYTWSTGLNANTQYSFRVKARDTLLNESSYYACQTTYTSASTPSAPTVNGATATTLNVNPVSGGAEKDISIYVEEGSTCDYSGGLGYVQANGTYSTGEVYQSDATWSTVTVTGLTPNTQYAFCSRARNGDNDVTAIGSATSSVTTASLTSIIISDSGGYTNDSTPSITLTYSGGTPTLMRFSCDNTNWNDSVAFTSPYSLFNITNGATGCTTTNGSKTIYAQIAGINGAFSASASDTTYYDTTSPAISSLSDNGATDKKSGDTVTITFDLVEEGSGQTTNPTVNITQSTDTLIGAASYTSRTGSGTSVSPYVYTYTYTVPTGNYANVKIKVDATDNIGNAATQSVLTSAFNIDNTAPTAAPTCSPGTSYFISSTGTISCTVGSGGTVIRYTTDGTAPSASSSVWSNQAFSATTTLKVISCDAANNCYLTANTYTYTQDNTAPTGGSFTINSGATYTTSQTGNTLNVTCPTDDWATVQMAYGNSASPTNWTTCTATVSSYDLGSGQGTKTVYMRFRDGGQNTTSDTTDTITLDSVAPTISSVTSVAGDTSSPYVDTTNDSSTNIIFVSSDATTSVSACKWNTTDVAYASMANTCASTTSCVTNLSGEGTKTVYIRCIDTAGNAMASSQQVDYTINATPPSASCSITEGTNPGYQYQTGTTLYYNSGFTGAFAVNVTASDPISGIEKVNFPTLATGFTPTSTDDTSSPYSQTYSWTTSATTAPGAKNATVYSNSGLTNTCNFTVTRDVTAPTGTITYSTQYITSTATDPSMTIGSVVEAGSGENTGTRTLQRATATLSAGSCGTYGSFATTTYGGTYPNITDTGTITDATCYKYQWLTTDNVGNTGTFTTTNEYKVDTTAPATSVSGVTESSADIYYASGSKTVFYKTPASSQNFTVNASASDVQSGILKVTFPGINVTGFTPTTDTDDTTSAYSNAYAIGATATTSPGSKTVTGHNNAGLTQTDNFTVTIDTTAPTGSSVTCPSAYDADGSFTVTGTSGSDAGSDIDTANSYFQRRIGTLSADACSGYGSYSNQGSANATNLGQTTLATGCYEYQYYTVDLVGNSTTSSTCVVKVDTTLPTVSIDSITESSAYIYDNGSTLYYKNNVTTPGSFTINVTAADADTGIASVSGSTEFGDTPSDSVSAYTLVYSIEQSSTCSTPITVTATANSGSTNNTTRTCTLDTTVPTVTSTTENDADNIVTNGTSIVITSNGADAGSGMDTCVAYWDSNTAYAGTETSLGDLGTDCDGTVTTPDSTDGTWYYCVRPIDKVSNENYSCTNAVTYDETAPTTAPTCSPGTSYFSSTTGTISCTVGSGGTVIRYTSNGTAPTAASAVWSDQAFSATTTLRVISCDAVNNCYLTDNSYTYTQDTTAPTATGFAAAPDTGHALDSGAGSIDVSWTNITETNLNLTNSYVKLETDTGSLVETKTLTSTEITNKAYAFDSGTDDNVAYTAILYVEDDVGLNNTYTADVLSADRTSPSLPSITVTADNTYNKADTDVNDIDTNLVGYWAFEDGAGSTTVEDWSNNDNTGTVTGANFAGGKTGNGDSMDFDYGTDGISIPHASELEPASITVGFWTKLNSDATRDVLVTKWSGYTTEVNADGTFKWGLNGLSSQYFGTQQISFGDWHYLAGTFDAASGEQCNYIDGVQTECQTVTGSISYNQTALKIGYSNMVNGLVDEVRIYNAALTPSQIINVMQSGVINKTLYHSDALAGTYTEMQGFEDDFLNGTAGASPSTQGWTVVDAGDSSSDFDVQIQADGSISFPNTATTAKGSDYISYTLPTALNKAKIEFDVYIGSGATSWNIRFQTNNGIFFANNGSGAWAEHTALAGFWKFIATSVSEDAWHKWTILMDTDTGAVQYFLDDVHQLTYNHPGLISTTDLSTIQFYDYGYTDATSYLRNIKVMPIFDDDAIPDDVVISGDGGHGTNWSNDNTVDFSWAAASDNGTPQYFKALSTDAEGNTSSQTAAASSTVATGILGYEVACPNVLGEPVNGGLLADEDMEEADTSSWTTYGGATVTKQTSDPRSGSRNIRLARNGASYYGVYQTVLTSGKSYRVHGWARSDGNAYPVIMSGDMSNYIWHGSLSTSWQEFDEVVVAQDQTQLYLWAYGRVDGQYVEFDDVMITPIYDVNTSYQCTFEEGTSNYFYTRAWDSAYHSSSAWDYMGPYQIDTTAPTITTTTENDADNIVTNGTSITITSDGADASSGIDTCIAYWDDDNTGYEADETSLGDLGTDCDGPITIPNSTDGTWYLCVRPLDNAESSNYDCTNALTYDESSPTGTSITPTSTRIINSNYPSFTVSDGTDSGSGINTATRELQRSEATYASNACGSYGSYSGVTYSGTYPNISDQTASGSKCYKYKWIVSDNVGNTTTTSETAEIVRVPMTTITITAGNNQSYGSSTNNPIGYTLPTPLQVRVTDGGTNYALAGEVTVDFDITSTPTTPNATGQSMSVASNNTNATGYASSSLTFGDRAGVYQVTASSTHSSITVEPTFTATAGQHFSLVVTEASMSIDLNAITNASDTASPTITVTTNAASYNVALKPDVWPISAALDEILNWATLLGFGWNLNSGTTTAYSETTGNPALTTVYTCTGDTCQGAKVIDINIDAAIDTSYAPGAYSNTLTISGESISY